MYEACTTLGGTAVVLGAYLLIKIRSQVVNIRQEVEKGKFKMQQAYVHFQQLEEIFEKSRQDNIKRLESLKLEERVR